MLGNPTCYQNAIPSLCWIFVNQPFHLETVRLNDVEKEENGRFCFSFQFQFVTSLQTEILQLMLNNPNFLRENIEMNNLIESVRYGLKSLLNSDETSIKNEILNDLLKVTSLVVSNISSKHMIFFFRIFQNRIRSTLKMFN